MDPLSITAGVIAILQAVDRLAGLAGQLRELVDAPTEISALLSESADNKVLFKNLKELLDASNDQSVISTQTTTVITALVEEGRNIILQLEKIISGQLLKPSRPSLDNEKKVRRIAWVIKRGHVERLTRKLKDVRLSIAAYLASVNTSSQFKISLNIQNISLSFQQSSHI